jgi:hypothetical protein
LLDLVKQVLHASTGPVKAGVADQRGPMSFDFRDAITSVAERSPSPQGGEDQFSAPVRRIWPAFKIAQPLQLIHEFGRRRQAQLSVSGKTSEPNPLNSDVAKNMQMRLADIPVTAILRSREQVAPKRRKQANQQLTDGKPIGGQVS